MHPEQIETYLIVRESIDTKTMYILDEQALIHHRYHAKKPMLFIIRLDCFIAYCTKTLDPTAIYTFFERYLTI